MRTTWIATLIAGIGLTALAAGAFADGSSGKPDAGKGEKKAGPTYNGEVKALFDRNGCLECHNPQKVRKSKIDLTAYDGAVKDVTKGDPDASKMIKLIVSGKMPPKKSGKKVSDEDLATLKAWISAGAPEQ
jgi:cytochrome c551/c552